LEKEDLTEAFRRVGIPVQIMLGSHDPICGDKAEAFLRALMPEARFYIFQQCGHFPFLSQPHGFNRMLDHFLQNTEAAT